MKRQFITCLIVLSPLCGASLSRAHSIPLPVVGMTAKLEEESLTYRLTIPTFAMKILENLSENESKENLDKLTSEIEDFFAETCPVKVDGITVRPVMTSINIFSPPPGGFNAAAMDSSDTNSPSVNTWIDANLTLTYGMKGKPRQLSLVWKLFPQESAIKSETVTVQIDDLNQVIAIINEYGKRKFVTFLPDEPEYVWHSEPHARSKDIMATVPDAAEKPVSLPILSVTAGIFILLLLPLLKFHVISKSFTISLIAGLVVLAIATKESARMEFNPFWKGRIKVPEESQAKDIFAALHKNIYRAFDYVAEDDIYDALSQSVTGELLDEIYSDIYKGLILSEEGGALCQIDKVEILNNDFLSKEPDSEPPNYKISCSWRVIGLVEHWGHIHRRVNEYSAVYTLMPFNDKWKISDVEMNEQERIDERQESGSVLPAP